MHRGPPHSPQFLLGKCETNGFRGGRAGRAPRLRGLSPGSAPENKGDSQPLSSAALSITSTSKAVACAVISTAGNVTTRPTAQTTTSARAMVSGRHGTTRRAAKRLRRSSVLPRRRRRPAAPSFPLPSPRAAPGDPAQHPAAPLLPARPESYGDERRRRRPGVTAGVLYVSHRSEERKAAVSCGESCSLHCPRGARRLSRSKAGNGRQKRSQTPTGSGLPPRGSEQRSRASPARSCRHVPSCAARAPPCSEPPVGAGLRPSPVAGPPPAPRCRTRRRPALGADNRRRASRRGCRRLRQTAAKA